MFVFVNSVDLAVIEALRYGKGLRADELIAVHFMVDATHAAQLRKRWDDFDLDTRLRVVDCPDRRVTRAAQLLVAKASKEHPDTNVTVLLPRRTYAPLLGRLLHDRTADKIARAVSLIPDAAATIVPYDVQSRIKEAYPERFEQRVARELDKLEAWVAQGEDQQRRRLRAPRAAVVGDHRGGPDSRTARHLRRTGQRSRGHRQTPADVSADRGRRRQRGDQHHVPSRRMAALTSSPVSCCGSPGRPARAATGRCRWSTRRITSSRIPRIPTTPGNAMTPGNRNPWSSGVNEIRFKTFGDFGIDDIPGHAEIFDACFSVIAHVVIELGAEQLE